MASLQTRINALEALETEHLDLQRRMDEVSRQRKKLGQELFGSCRNLYPPAPGTGTIRFRCGGTTYEITSGGKLMRLDQDVPTLDPDSEV